MRGLTLLALAACLAMPGALQAQTVKAGVEAWQRGEHARAVGIWRPLADAGDADAAFNIGQAYRLGRGVPTDLAAAQRWLDAAAAKNHTDAQATLGLLLFQNGDTAAGLNWLAKAAERGEPRSLLIYGTALFNGDGVRRDPVRGYAMVSRAAAQGLAPAKTTLAEMDGVLPAEQRRRGVALALEMAQGGARPPSTARQPAIPQPAGPQSARRDVKASPAPPPPALAAGGKWRIQLGAFARRASAEALFKRLSANPPVAGRQPFLVPAGAVIRLQVGPFPDRASAAAACKTLAARAQACFPVAP
jgi:uncharacterized protein